MCLRVRTKILYISEAPIYGGAERYLITLAEGIDRSRYDLEMILSDQAPERLRQALRDLDIPTILVPPITGKTDLSGIMRHVACFRARRPTIVHFNLSNPLHGQYAMIAARIAKVPFQVATLHLPPRSTTPTKRGRFFERQTLCNLNMLIAVCDSSRELVVKHFGLDPARTTAVHNGIDADDFDQEVSKLAPVSLKQGQEFIIGTVGRLSLQKGFDVLLDAMPAVLAEFPNVRLAIAGEGPEEENLRKQCNTLHIDKSVDFLGMRSDIPALLQAFDLFVLPSRYESFPITILEVMAASKPIVSTSVDGIPESVVKNETGLLVPAEDAKSLTNALTKLVQDDDLRAHMAKQARQRVEALFTLNQMAQKTQAIYDRFCL